MKPNRTTIIADREIMERFRKAAEAMGAAGVKGNRFGRALQAALIMWSDATDREKLQSLDRVDREINRAAAKARKRIGSAADAAADAIAANQAETRVPPNTRRSSGQGSG